MEQQDSSYDYVCDQSLPLSANYPWFVADNLGVEEDGSKDHIFYTLHDPLSIYKSSLFSTKSCNGDRLHNPWSF